MGKYPPSESWASPGTARFSGSPRQEVPEGTRILAQSITERLKKAMPGEESAYMEYLSLAHDAELAGMPATAMILQVMAQEEKEHWSSLFDMVRSPELG